MNRPLIYLRSNSQRKDHLAREIAARDGITPGTICVFSTLELGSTLLFRSGPTGRLDLQPGLRKCLHYYHYFLDPEVGFGHVRVQTWFPFGVHIYLNGRAWLARQMDRAGLGYVRQDNCFTTLHDFARAQALADEQQRVHWPTPLDRLTRPAVAGLEETFAACPVPYYWSLEESEWASDVVFRDPAELQRWYPLWLRHGMSRLSSKDVLRFLGKKMPRQEGRYWNCEGEVLTDLKGRAEGYASSTGWAATRSRRSDKRGVLLRVETPLNAPAHLKVYRPKEGGAAEDLQWRRLRKGVADVHRRGGVSGQQRTLPGVVGDGARNGAVGGANADDL